MKHTFDCICERILESREEDTQISSVLCHLLGWGPGLNERKRESQQSTNFLTVAMGWSTPDNRPQWAAFLSIVNQNKPPQLKLPCVRKLASVIRKVTTPAPIIISFHSHHTKQKMKVYEGFCAGLNMLGQGSGTIRKRGLLEWTWPCQRRVSLWGWALKPSS